MSSHKISRVFPRFSVTKSVALGEASVAIPLGPASHAEMPKCHRNHQKPSKFQGLRRYKMS